MSISTTTNFFLIGATGYIGGAVLTRFLTHPHARAFRFSALVRDPRKAAKFRDLGVRAVVGSLSDSGLVQRLASEADIVISAADSDDLGAIKAILAGLRKRHALGTVPIFIQTSATDVLRDDAKGMHAGTTIYDDSDADQMESISPAQTHRDVDQAIINADSEGYIRSYIILPSTVYGLATGPLVIRGIQNPHSKQIPYLISIALARGRAGIVGEGKNISPNVEIHELADLYALLYDAIMATPDTGHGRNGFYFGASGEHTLYEVGRAIGSALLALGKSSSADPEPTTFTREEENVYPRVYASLGSNTRCRPTRSRSLGWKPVKTTGDMLASVQSEMKALIRKAGTALSNF
ncbi:NAD(P)-binding protein [Mycena crocata]|nr:NAD(P)-binding protein [Mycena crocata]